MSPVVQDVLKIVSAMCFGGAAYCYYRAWTDKDDDTRGADNV